MLTQRKVCLAGLFVLLPFAGCDGHSATPAADAGLDLQVSGLTFVELNGNGSAIHGGPLGYEWTQLAGVPVALSDATSPSPSFITPNENTTLVFQLTVSEGHKSESDSVRVDVSSTIPAYASQLLSSTPIHGGGADRATHSVYDPQTRRLFVLNAHDERVDVLSLANPSNPIPIGILDLNAVSGAVELGMPTGIALSGTRVAVSVEADPLQLPGVVQLWNTTKLAFLGQYIVGAAPQAVVFTPDGSRLLTADEGDPSLDFTADPEGSVTIVHLWQPQPASDGIELPEGPAWFGGDTGVFHAQPFGDRDPLITTVDFHAFDALAGQLIDSGVRILGPHSTVSQDLEPVSIALSPDGQSAIVSCQENNAIALLDLVKEQFVDVRPLGLKAWDDPLAVRHTEMNFFAWQHAPLLAPPAGGIAFGLGGFSGMSFAAESGGAYYFWAIPERGPTLAPLQANADPMLETPFALPDYTARLALLRFDPALGSIELEQELPLLRSDEYTPISGLPNLLAAPEGMAFHDGQPVGLDGHALPLDPFGANFGALAILPNGQIWLADRYRPSLYAFNSNGALAQRYVPVGSDGFGKYLGIEALPAVYAQRHVGSGFDGLAYDASSNKLYAFMSSALDNPDSADDEVALESRIARILEFDLATHTTTGEYVYVLPAGARISEAAWFGAPGTFLVLESNDLTGAQSAQTLQRVTLDKATNLLALGGADYALIAGPGGVLERTAPSALASLVPAIAPVHKSVQADLAAGGWTAQPGLQAFAVVDQQRMLLLSNDAFGLRGADLELGTGAILPGSGAAERTTVALVQCLPMGFDPSDRDGGIAIESWPVQGMYMPDALLRYEADGFGYLITANEGKSRDHLASHGLLEERRVSELVLDPSVFPNAAALRQDSALGRLLVSTLSGDVDGDYEYEQLCAFGTRSFSVRDTDGALLYDSGDLLERMSAELVPDRFNSEGMSTTFDLCSDDRGPEPKSLALGLVGGTPYLFVGLEQLSGVMVLDMTVPTAPSFACYLDSPQDRGAHGLVFIPAAQSPTGEALLVSTNASSGSVAVFALDF